MIFFQISNKWREKTNSSKEGKIKPLLPLSLNATKRKEQWHYVIYVCLAFVTNHSSNRNVGAYFHLTNMLTQAWDCPHYRTSTILTNTPSRPIPRLDSVYNTHTHTGAVLVVKMKRDLLISCGKFALNGAVIKFHTLGLPYSANNGNSSANAMCMHVCACMCKNVEALKLLLSAWKKVHM